MSYEIEYILQPEGVRIVHPEELDLAEQIKLMNAHDRLCGSVGSALHTGLFALSRKRIVYLVPQPKVNSNSMNIDGAKGHVSSFLFCPSKQTGLSAFFS